METGACIPTNRYALMVIFMFLFDINKIPGLHKIFRPIKANVQTLFCMEIWQTTNSADACVNK